MKKLLYIMSVTTLLLGLTACGSKDDFTDSIFDTSIKPVDPNATTYEFDQWLYDNFTKPYNVEFQYKFNLNASDYSFQLAPAAYDKSQLLAYFIKHLFYDVYIKFAGEDFMKQYGPRIFHFIGSSGYSPLTGTEVLGLASGGVKITLYNLNEMKPYVKGTTVYNAEDIEVLNEKYFHTMHHEFSHIMHQTKSYPVTFGQVTSGTYDPIDWHKRDSVESHRLGYVTHYASSANYEDFVETLSCIITDDDYRWMMRIINACAPGWRAGDKEEVINSSPTWALTWTRVVRTGTTSSSIPRRSTMAKLAPTILTLTASSWMFTAATRRSSIRNTPLRLRSINILYTSRLLSLPTSSTGCP